MYLESLESNKEYLCLLHEYLAEKYDILIQNIKNLCFLLYFKLKYNSQTT